MIHINLLSVRVSKKKELGKQQLVLFFLLVVLGLVGNYVWNHLRAQDLAARQARVKSTQQEIAKLVQIIGEVNDIKSQQAALKDKIAVLDKLKAGRAGPVRVLDELATITPKRLWFKKIAEEKGGAVAFEGSAINIDDVSALLKALKDSSYFSVATLKKTASRTEGRFKVVDFTMNANVNYTPIAAVTPATAPATPAK
jgi:type IV pilus assembly protein PilN